MAPNGGPSMTSQARAAELNAAAAARARILNGELSDFSTLPSSQHVSLADPTHTYKSLEGPRSTPSQFLSSHTNNTEHIAVESFRHPNRPVDRYYPPVATNSAPVTVYAYPQPQYADPRAVPTVCAPALYPVATEYYQPMYQPAQSYQQVYPSYINGYPLPVSPLPREAVATATHQRATRSVAASPTKPGPPQPVQVPATPPAKLPRGPSPVKSVARGPARSPLKKLDTTPSPKKPTAEILQYFTPGDLSPPKVEVELMRFKVALTKIVPPKDEEKPSGNSEDKTTAEKSPAKWVNGHEGDNTHHKDKDPEVDKDEQPMPRAKLSGPPTVVGTSNLYDQSATEVHPEAKRQPSSLDNSPLARKSYRKSIAKMIQPYSFLPPGFMPRSDLRGNVRPASQQPQMFRVEENHSTKPDKSMFQIKDRLFHVLQKKDKTVGEATPKAAPRRLQSPFQLRPRSPVTYYKPIVNKYPRNVFALQQTRLEELRKLETGRPWLTFRQKPVAKHLPGPFKGFPRFPLIDENAQRPMNTGVLMAPPGFAAPIPILLPRSVHWNPESGPSNRATTYYDRVLEAEDWFHQSILEKKESSNKFQKKLSEVQSMILCRKNTFDVLPPVSKAVKAAQVTELIKRVSENLISYTDTAENKKRGFEFSDIELSFANGLKRPKVTRLKNRRALRGRNCGGKFNIAPGSERFDEVVVGNELPFSSDS